MTRSKKFATLIASDSFRKCFFSQPSQNLLDNTVRTFDFQSDYDNIDFLNELREGCLEAYAGIIQGLKGDGNVNQPAPGLVMLQPQVSYIVQFITVVAQDSNHSDAAVAACAGLIG